MAKGCWIAVGVAGVAIVASCLGLGTVALGFYDFPKAERELPAAVAAYRAAGLPWTAKDLSPPAPKGANAAPAIRAALKAMPGKKADADLAGARKKGGPVAEAVLAPYAKALGLVGAAKGERADFGRDWDLGPSLRLPEYEPMRILARATALRAERASARGDDGAALRDLSLARRLGEWAGQDPNLLGMLVHIAVDSVALEGAERCLVQAKGRPAGIDRYARWLAEDAPKPDFGRALRGEAYFGVAIDRNLGLFGGEGNLADPDASFGKIDPATLRRDGLPDDGKARAFLARHLQFWSRAAQETDGFRGDPERVGRRLQAMQERVQGAKGLSYAVSKAMLPLFDRAGEATVTLEARRAVERGFAEALGAHARTGRWPDRVSPLDPFTGKPLMVKATGKEFRVYSVGRDRRDDGGLLKREAVKQGKKDVADEVAVFPPVAR